jgi:hypothetical protein
MPYQDVRVSGLAEVRKLLDGQRVTKELKVKVSSLVTGLHSDIRKEVFTRYKINQDKLNSALVGKSISNVTEGANILKSGFIYKHKATPLAPFFSSSFMGNINAGAMRQGLVHRVEIRRGLQGIVYGLDHRGGFIPVKKTLLHGATPKGKPLTTNTRQSKFKNKKDKAIVRVNMYERKSYDPLPLRLLFAPSPAQLVQRTLNSSSSLLQKRVDEFTQDVTNLFIKK